MKKLFLLFLAIILPFSSILAQEKIYIWSGIDPGWKNQSLEYWANVKGYGKSVPIEMSEMITEYYSLAQNMLELSLKQKILISDIRENVIQADNPGEIILGDNDLFLDLQCRILEVTDKYPLYRTRKLGIEPVIVYSYTIYNSRGGIVASNELFDKVDYRYKVRPQVRGMSDHRRDIETVKLSFTESIKGSTTDRIITSLEENISGIKLQGVTADPVLFRKIVGLVFENRKVLYPYDYQDISFVQQAYPLPVYTANSESSPAAGANTANTVLNQLDELMKGSRYFALIIGINQYGDPSITDLEEPVKDAMKLYNTLVTNYTFEKENIAFLTNPTRNRLILTLDSLARRITDNDNLLVFYAGHGIWDDQLKKGFWLPSDASARNRANWFSNSDLRDYIGGIKAKHTLLISDACFSGGIFKTRDAFIGVSPAIIELYKLPSRKAMTSGIMTTVPDKSVFLEYLVRRLEENKNYYISSEMLFASFKEAVINNSPTNQVPKFGEIRETGDEGGDFLFIRKTTGEQ